MVKSAGRRKDSGIEAFLKVHDWFSRIPGMGMAERRSKVTMPSKKEGDLIYDLEKWKRDLREIESQEDTASALPYAYRLAALKRILVGKIQDHVRWSAPKMAKTGDEHRGSGDALEK